LYYNYGTERSGKMKIIPIVTFLGSGALITALTTWLGIATTIELQLLIFINVSVLLAVLLRKYLYFTEWFGSERKTSPSVGRALSNTAWFVTACLGLKKNSSQQSSQKHSEQKTGNDEIGKIVRVVEPIDPCTASGKVTYMGKKWPAKASDSTAIARGERVKIIGRDFLTLIVEKINKQPTVVKKNSF
jgi:membrane protein implicated in regulation of membrane protease activity